MGNLYIQCIARPLGLVTDAPASRADQLLSDKVRKDWESEQEELKKKMVLEDTEDLREMASSTRKDRKMFYVAGVDVSFVKGDDVNACAALVVLSYPKLETVYSDCEMIQLTAPYIPGFLAFREVPFIVKLFEKLRNQHPQYIPHVVMVDGNGILHPRGFGSACHLGVELRLPCIGVAKKLFQVDGLENDKEHKDKELLQEPGIKLVEAKDVRWLSHDKATTTLRRCLPSVYTSLEREAEERNDSRAAGLSKFTQNYQFVLTLHMICDVLPHLSDLSKAMQIEAMSKGGDTFPLIGNSGKTLGKALRSCDSSKNPIYVSPGHLVTMDTAVSLVHSCCKYRVPEPVRLADINSREYLRINFKPEEVGNGT